MPSNEMCFMLQSTIIYCTYGFNHKIFYSLKKIFSLRVGNIHFLIYETNNLATDCSCTHFVTVLFICSRCPQAIALILLQQQCRVTQHKNWFLHFVGEEQRPRRFVRHNECFYYSLFPLQKIRKFSQFLSILEWGVLHRDYVYQCTCVIQESNH
jgi:hypothetical protein